ESHVSLKPYNAAIAGIVRALERECQAESEILRSGSNVQRAATRSGLRIAPIVRFHGVSNANGLVRARADVLPAVCTVIRLDGPRTSGIACRCRSACAGLHERDRGRGPASYLGLEQSPSIVLRQH